MNPAVWFMSWALLGAPADAAGPATRPAATPATAPVSAVRGFVSAERHNALKRDRDALAQQLAFMQEELSRLQKENHDLRRALSAATRPVQQR